MIRLVMPSLILAGLAMGLGSVFTGSGHNLPFYCPVLFLDGLFKFLCYL